MFPPTRNGFRHAHATHELAPSFCENDEEAYKGMTKNQNQSTRELGGR
jgi:hypothetical protein